MDFLKSFKWVVAQKPGTLLGLFLFASTYLVFLARTGSRKSALEISLWGLLFLSSALLTGHGSVALFSKVSSSIRTARRNRVLSDHRAVAVLKGIKEEGNRILNDPLFQSGLAGAIDIEQLAMDLQMPFDLVRYFVIRFRDANWLIYTVDGDIYGVSDYGIQIMREKKLV